MATYLINTDLQEMVMEWPLRRLSADGIHTNNFQIDNKYLKATVKELSLPQFCITDHYMLCHSDMKMYSKGDENNAIWFCAAMQGNVSCYYNPIARQEKWREGEANLLSFENEASCTCFCKKTPFRMREIMFSKDYIKALATQYPDLFGNHADNLFCGKRYRAYRENKAFCPGIYTALNDLMQSCISGNAAQMYADAKVREILSLFLCRSFEKECASSSCCGTKDIDKIRDAKAIMEQHYLNPPSLHRLSLMVGTNECTLKKGFKALFGTTVFGYLFDYRMDLASCLLLDSDTTVQEIALTVGYEHQSHFSTAFKRKFGVSPVDYRRNRRGTRCSLEDKFHR